MATGTGSRSITAATAMSGKNGDKPQRPELKDMLRELEQVTNWQRLMIDLGVRKNKIDEIEEDHRRTDRRKQEAFDWWLRQTPNASWKDIIDALSGMDENTLALKLERQYTWKDPRVSVNQSYLKDSRAPLTARPIGDVPCQKYLPPLMSPLQYYTLEDKSEVARRPVDERQSARTTEHFARLIRKKQEKAYNFYDFFESIEKSDSKEDFKVGFEARFGKVYWKLDPQKVLRDGSYKEAWMRSKSLRKCTFYSEVDQEDVRKLLSGKEQLGDTLTQINLKFSVEGRDEGTYRAVIANYEKEQTFYVDAVYRARDESQKSARINMAVAGSKYDFRISDCSECVVMEDENSIPYQIAKEISTSMNRLGNRKLHLILRGELTSKRKSQSSWKVKYIRQRVQTQYSWKPERKWILVHYDVDVFDQEKNPTVQVDDAPLNKPVDIPEFDYSRMEVELWGQKIFPKNVGKTQISTNKYFYPEGVCGLRLGGEERPPYDWTAQDLMKDFNEFLGDAFEIAHILSG